MHATRVYGGGGGGGEEEGGLFRLSQQTNKFFLDLLPLETSVGRRITGRQCMHATRFYVAQRLTSHGQFSHHVVQAAW